MHGQMSFAREMGAGGNSLPGPQMRGTWGTHNFGRPQQVEAGEKCRPLFRAARTLSRKWYVVNAEGQTLGRLATKAASVLSGKLNPQYVPYIDMGDHVIVINAEKVRLTGLKSQKKLYRHYTGFPGGLREESFTRLISSQAGEGAGRGDQGHAAQDEDGPRDGPEVEGVSRRQAPASGAKAG